MSLLLLPRAFVLNPVNTRFCLFVGGVGSESARDDRPSSAVELGKDETMMRSVPADGITPSGPEGVTSSAGDSCTVRSLGAEEGITATSDAALGKSSGLLRFRTEGVGVCGTTACEESRVREGCAGSEQALPAAGCGRAVVTGGSVGDDNGSGRTDCVAFDWLLSKPWR